MSHQRFGEIRSLLHQDEPSEELWHRLTQLLWGWRSLLSQEMIASYCNGILTDWPDELRVVPKGWLRAILRGEDADIFSICRTMSLKNKQITPEKLAQICDTTHLSSLTMLDLSDNRLASKFNELKWIETFSRASFLPSLKQLHLGSCWLNDASLAMLATLDMPSLRHLDLSNNIRLCALPDFFAAFSASASIEVLQLGWNLTSEAANMRYDYYQEGPELYADYLRPKHLVEAMHHLPALRELNLYRNSCEPDFILDHDALFSRLEVLHINIDYANAAWREAILNSPALRGLRELYVSRLDREDVELSVDALIEMKQHKDCKLEVLGLPFIAINHLRVHDARMAMLEGVEIVQVD